MFRTMCAAVVLLAFGAPAQAAEVDAMNGGYSLSTVQQALNELGYDAGPVDGLIGPRTRAAIRAYQTSASLPVDGEPSPNLLQHLQRSLDERAQALAPPPVTNTVTFVTPAPSGPYNDGLNAYKRKDYQQAIAIWMPLAEEGHVGAQYNLARMHDEGIGVARNDAMAAQWYIRAAEQGFVPAQLALALAHLDGRGVPLDVARGLALLREAAAVGHADAQFELGALYREGQVVPKDYIEAVRWYRAAAAQGHTHAQYSLGFMYGSGYGTAQDFVMAYYYYDLAASHIPISAKARDHLAEYMSADELRTAVSMVSQRAVVATSP